MKNPKCPSCETEVKYFSFRPYNRLDFKCLGCGVSLRSSLPYTLGFIATFMLAFVFGGTAAGLEDLGVWHMSESLLYFSIFLICISISGRLVWSKVEFRVLTKH
jgi:hypothetical protein